MTEKSAGVDQEPSDPRKLVERIGAGDRGAEEELVKLYGRSVLLIATARTRDREAARELTQDVLIAVLQAVRACRVREPDKLAAFVQGTARNLINSYLRGLSLATESLDSIDMAGPDPVEPLEAADRHRLLRQELQKFRPQDQKILLLSLVDGHSLAEIAQRVGLSHATVRARKSRMIKKIMKTFLPPSHK